MDINETGYVKFTAFANIGGSLWISPEASAVPHPKKSNAVRITRESRDEFTVTVSQTEHIILKNTALRTTIVIGFPVTKIRELR